MTTIVALLWGVLVVFGRAADAEDVARVLQERAWAHGAEPAEVLAVARCETGGTLSPWRSDGSLRRGAAGEVGVGQWLPGRGNHWSATPAAREAGIDLLERYAAGDPDALWYDLDMLAWSFGREAPPGFRRGWTCWRQT